MAFFLLLAADIEFNGGALLGMGETNAV